MRIWQISALVKDEIEQTLRIHFFCLEPLSSEPEVDIKSSLLHNEKSIFDWFMEAANREAIKGKRNVIM